MTAQLEHSQCHLVEMDSITSLFIVYRYDSTTGTFTVSSGGDGYYYLSVFLTVDGGEYAYFNVEINGERICTAFSDQEESPENDSKLTSCSGVVYAVEGICENIINIIHRLIILLFLLFLRFCKVIIVTHYRRCSAGCVQRR